MWISFGLFALYVLFIAACAIGLRRLSMPLSSPAEGVSIVVAFRNEQDTLGACMDSILASLQASGLQGELILVDDHSTDASASVLRSSRAANVYLVQATGHGKKAALADGIGRATYSRILLTDADVVVSEGWVLAMASGQGLSAGWVQWQGKGFWGNLWRAEGLALGWVTAGTFGLNLPVAVNGASLALPANLAVRPFSGTRSSGDDVQRLKVATHEGLPMRFVLPSEALVSTMAPSSLQAGLTQRMRWASKNAEVGHLPGQVAGVVLLLGNLSWLLALFFHPLAGVGLFIAKWALDAAVVGHAARLERGTVSWLPFFLLECFYPFYLFWMGLVAPFFSYAWKDRRTR